MEASVFIILQTFFNAREKMFTNSLPFVAWDVHFSVFSGTILWLTDMCFRCSPALAGEVFSNVAFRPIAREQKYLMDYKKKLWDEVEHDM